MAAPSPLVLSPLVLSPLDQNEGLQLGDVTLTLIKHKKKRRTQNILRIQRGYQTFFIPRIPEIEPPEPSRITDIQISPLVYTAHGYITRRPDIQSATRYIE